MLERKYLTQFSIVTVLLFLQAIVFSSLALFISGEWQKSADSQEQVLGEIRIAGLTLSGLSRQEAEQRLLPVVRRIAVSPISLSLDGNLHQINPTKLKLTVDLQKTLAEAMELSREQSGILAWWDRLFGESLPVEVNLRLAYDRGELSRQVIEISKQIDRKAIPATLRISGKSAVVVPEVEGYRVNVDQTVAKIETALQKGGQATSIPIVVEKDIPAITRTTLAGADTFLGEQETVINAAVPKRLNNVVKAAQLLDGTVILPQQLFSFLDRVGPFVAEKGYEPVPVLEDEEIPDGVAGGATQVASTLYVAAVKSHLPIVERHNNRRPVEFLPIGEDAYVDGKEFDLRFINRTSAAIFIHAEVINQKLRVALFGATPTEGEVTLEIKNEETFPPDTIVRVDPELPPGGERIVRIGKAGLRAKVYTVWKDKSGKEHRELLSDNFYKPLHNIIASGPGKEGEENKNQDASQQDGSLFLPDTSIDSSGSSGNNNRNTGSNDTGSTDTGSRRPPDIDPLPENMAPAQSGSSGSSNSGAKQKKPEIIYLN